MVRQSQPVILLTRPLVQSQRFADQVGGALIAPLMAPEFLPPAVPPGDFAAVILTSETGVEAAWRISAAGFRLPRRAFCVGNATAAAAGRAGFDASSAEGNVSDLLAHIVMAAPQGRLLQLRAQDSAGDLQKRLISAGIETVSAIVYRQKARALTAEAAALLHGTVPVILPIFSPRSARLLAAEMRRIAATAPLWVVALSPAVAEAFDFPAELAKIAARPDADAMCDVISHLRGLG